MPRRLAPVLLLSSFALLYSPHAARSTRVSGPQLRSRYDSLREDAEVSTTTTLLSRRISLARRDSVLVEATGTVAPGQVPGSAGSIVATLDGKPVTSTSTIDWRESSDPVRHTFDVVGATRAAAGRHTVRLVADPISGSLTVSATSNLSVFVHPAHTVAARTLGAAKGPFEFQSYGTTGPDTPHQALLQATVDGRLKTVALGSASGSWARHDGDAMVGLYRDGAHPGNAASLWSVNDVCTCAETQAPFYTHAFYGASGRKHIAVSLDASEFPWSTAQGEDPASYTVEPGARLVVLNGMPVAGHAPTLPSGFAGAAGTATDYWCLGTDQGWPGCPAVGTDVLVAQGVVRIPRGNPGVVLFEGKSRVQADGADAGGIVSMWLTVDGVRRGATGVQELRSPFSISERTIATSYLAAGSGRLRPGRHVVRLYASAAGGFAHVALVRDLPLVWFG
jgi:hypothetical protein